MHTDQSFTANLVQECPTIWRLYEYVTDHEREAILRHRESKQSLALGRGGEGYIASDEWCYNCGNTGHLGDVSSSTMLGVLAPVRATQVAHQSSYVPAGLPRTPSPTRRAVRAIRLWPLQHPLGALLRRLHRADACPRTARLGSKRRDVRRRLGHERPHQRRQARAQQGPVANGAARARAPGRGARRPRRLVRERSEQARQRQQQQQQSQPQWRATAKCERQTRRPPWSRWTQPQPQSWWQRQGEERREDTAWKSLEERRPSSAGAAASQTTELDRARVHG